jgi:hypothetical protein
MRTKRGLNLLTTNFSGTVGGQFVLRNVGTRQVLASRPNIDPNREPTPSQRAHQLRFKMAAMYAKANQTDPAYVAAAAADRDRTAYNYAHRDHMRAPEVTGINVSEYQGQPGQVIRVVAVDDFQVTGVRVSLVQDGQVIEQGEAELQADGLTWHYVATKPAAGEIDVMAAARDKPGNVTESSIVVSL